MKRRKVVQPFGRLLDNSNRVGYSYLSMPTVLRDGGFEIKMYFNDHPPAHVHVFKGGGEVKINLDPTVVAQVWNMTKPEAQKAKRVVSKNRKYLLETWEKMHGGQTIRS